MDEGRGMKLKHSIIIGIAIVVGLVLHAAVKSLPEYTRLRQGYEMQVRMMEMRPTEITVGSASMLYLPRISYRGLSIDVDYEFYAYVDGTLRKIDMVKE